MKLICADMLKALAELPENSVDSVITDPPYHLTEVSRAGSPRNHYEKDSPFARTRIGERGFMGKVWDGGTTSFQPETWAACLRVAKPGAYLFCFGGTRTFHRIACAIEDGGWILLETFCWLYGQGYPKSMNISARMDKQAGVDRPVVGTKVGLPGYSLKHSGKGGVYSGRADGSLDNSEKECEITAPVTDEAKLWNGYYTGIKPAFEPITCAMKPLDKSYLENARKWGVAGFNIDGCRIPSELPEGRLRHGGGAWSEKIQQLDPDKRNAIPSGRYPANLILDEEAAALLDAQTGTLKSGTGCVKKQSGKGLGHNNALGAESRPEGTPIPTYGDIGGASRFFYCAKASRAERDFGCEDMPVVHNTCRPKSGDVDGRTIQERLHGRLARNSHPTVKPLSLMQYLCRLSKTPTGGTVLDPFMGSGTTGMAALYEGRDFIGIDNDPHSVDIAQHRIGAVQRELFHSVASQFEDE